MATPDESQQAMKSDAQPVENVATAPAVNGSEKGGDKGKKPQKPAEAPQSTAEQKLSGKELKAKKQAEKQARRAAEKAQSGAPSASEPGPSTANSQTAGPSSEGGKQGAKAKQGQQPPRGAQAGTAQHRRTASQVPGPQAMPVRPKAAQSGGAKEPRKVSKEVGLFGHLYNQPRRYTMEGVSKDIHPAVLALGFQMSNYVICGSNARCVAMLLAFKKVRQGIAGSESQLTPCRPFSHTVLLLIHLSRVTSHPTSSAHRSTTSNPTAQSQYRWVTPSAGSKTTSST